MLKVDIKKKLNKYTLEVAFNVGTETLAILGPSGCGKSMTLKCIAGVETPDAGYIELNGRVLFDSTKKINLPPQQRRVGYLFQNYALFPNMTVEQNIAAGIKGDRKTKENIVSEKIKAFYLEGLEKQCPSQLSGGQQQRVALARLMAQNPDILMLDEPFSAMDNYLKWQLEQEVHEVLQSYGKPVLYVSHNRKEVYRLCDMVAVLYNGKLDTICSKNELFEIPRTVAVAQLIGCKNLSRIQRLGEHRVFAVDWGVELETGRAVPETAGNIGFFGHYIRPARAEEKNTIACRVLRVVEDNFSTIAILKPEGVSGIEDYSKILWEMDKAAWQKVPDSLGTITITLEAGHIMLLD
ncbi:MAG: sulfate/molybdate ABC transporter ATP-binding protein [Bacillota bacterium]